MKCEKCGYPVHIGDEIGVDLCNSCIIDAIRSSVETAAILERLEEVLGSGENLSKNDWCNAKYTDAYSCAGFHVGWPCDTCAAFYIKTGRMITEEDLNNG